MLVKTPTDQDLLYKHVATIHKSNNLSLLQNKISNVLYFNAYKELKAQEVHKISIGYLCKKLAYKGHNDYEIKKALKGLIGTVVEWNLLNDEKLQNEDWTASTMLASASIKKGGICEYSYSFHMRELLSDPLVYGVINMAYQANFHSKYGLALYENCVRFINIKQTGWLEISFFRELMGVPNDKYQIFRDFKRRVLDVAVNEVNTYSNLYVEPLLKKTGRKVSSIKFKLTKRDKKKKISLRTNFDELRSDSNLKKPNEKELFSILCRDFSLTEEQSASCLTQYSEDYIYEKINYINSSSTSVKNISAYLLSALKKNYQQPKTYTQIKNEAIGNAEKELELMKAQRFIDRLEDEFSILPSAKDLVVRFERHLITNDEHLHKLYLKYGFQNDAIALQCYIFCKNKFFSLYETLIDIK